MKLNAAKLCCLKHKIHNFIDDTIQCDSKIPGTALPWYCTIHLYMPQKARFGYDRMVYLQKVQSETVCTFKGLNIDFGNKQQMEENVTY